MTASVTQQQTNSTMENQKKGNLTVTTDNILPVIKKFLYSDHEIFLREMVANAVDATTKFQALARTGEAKNEEADSLKVSVAVDEKAGTITISDQGVGMTVEEIDKYINQIAFSGATEFVEKYKDNAQGIIGHFGLGFYSAFMVSDQVEIISRSYREGATAAHWLCDGGAEFTIEDAEKESRGTDVILHVSDDEKEFLSQDKLRSLLRKYCRFMPVKIVCGEKEEWKDGKMQPTGEPYIINDVEPIWTKSPSELKDEDYKKFYSALYPMHDEPLFWIHLNVDYPFTLTGVLYFPHIKSDMDIRRDHIQLYCNQMFVTDQVEGIVPDFLTLLHGVIDSPDIPLNVSRSYLQADREVKKISTYIQKKVADRLLAIFKDDRKQYEDKWADLRIFIHYGVLSQQDFYDRAKEFMLLTDAEGKHYTLDEYAKLIGTAQDDKEGNHVYLYATDKVSQYGYMAEAQKKGYSVLLMDGQLDTALVSMLETKLEKTRFARVDSDTIDRLIPKADDNKQPENAELLKVAFEGITPKLEGTDIMVDTRAMGKDSAAVVVTRSEQMRRMKEMSRLQPQFSFYGDMPDTLLLTVNTDSPFCSALMEKVAASTAEQIKPIDADVKGLLARKAALDAQVADKKPEEIDKAVKDDLDQTRDNIKARREERRTILHATLTDNLSASRAIKLALLRAGLLKGEALEAFVEDEWKTL